MTGAFVAAPDTGMVALLGPPPELGCVGEGFDDPVRFQLVETPSGATVVRLHADDMPVRVYAASSVPEVCEPVWAGRPTPVPLAVGTARARHNDNDTDVSGTRMNTFGTSVQGQVFRTADGARCRLSGHDRWLLPGPDAELQQVTAVITLACAGR